MKTIDHTNEPTPRILIIAGCIFGLIYLVKMIDDVLWDAMMAFAPQILAAVDSFKDWVRLMI